jgi:hypothetical protein
MSRLSRLVIHLGFSAAAAWAIALPAAAAEKEALPPQTPSHQTVPEAAAPGSGGGAPLSDKLDRQGGVIRPPAGIDPEITRPPPSGGSGMPVIPPPGTPGGEPGVKPK